MQLHHLRVLIFHDLDLGRVMTPKPPLLVTFVPLPRPLSAWPDLKNAVGPERPEIFPIPPQKG